MHNPGTETSGLTPGTERQAKQPSAKKPD